jgi:hypothetical protein
VTWDFGRFVLAVLMLTLFWLGVISANAWLALKIDLRELPAWLRWLSAMLFATSAAAFYGFGAWYTYWLVKFWLLLRQLPADW